MDSRSVKILPGHKIALHSDIRVEYILKEQNTDNWNVERMNNGETRKAGKYKNINEETRYRRIRFMRNTLARKW